MEVGRVGGGDGLDLRVIWFGFGSPNILHMRQLQKQGQRRQNSCKVLQAPRFTFCG